MKQDLSILPRLEDLLNAVKGFPPPSSRIPKRTVSGRPARKQQSLKTVATETAKASFDCLPRKSTKPTVRFALSTHDGHQPRPRSANRANEEAIPTKTGLYPAPRSKADRERLQPAIKKPSIIPKRVSTGPSAGSKPVKTNGISLTKKTSPMMRYSAAHKVEKRVYKEMNDEVSESSKYNKGDPFSQSDVMQLKIEYQDQIVQFEKLRSDLDDKQKVMLESYAKLQQTHEKMSLSGQTAQLPSPDELRVLNVANFTPEQLLILCAKPNLRYDDQNINKSVFPIDDNKITNLPNQLVSTCEQTLQKRKEIITWLDSLVKSGTKGIKFINLVSKVNEFTVENEMLNCSLDKVKSEFLQEFNEILAFIRKAVNETMELQVRNEELTYEIAELDTKNANLRKQLHTTEHLKSNTSKARVEELEKALKDEKCKRAILKDRLTRTEGQVKISTERAAHLEASLDESHSKVWSLETTVKQLHEQHDRLQSGFDKELSKLTELIKENSIKLEEIAEDREKLQIQKEDLEKQLQQLSKYYTESLNNTKTELKVHVAKVIEAEKKYNAEVDQRKKAEAKEEFLNTQLREAQSRCMELCKSLEDKELELSKSKAVYEELEATKQSLSAMKQELEDFKTKLIDQTETICNIERYNKDLLDEKDNLKSQLCSKDEQISTLEKKQRHLKDQLQNNESKMESYEQQLTSLRVQIDDLQNDFGEFDNLNELRQMVNKQRAAMLEATRQNGELAEAVQNKELELEQQNKLIIKHEDINKQLSEKEQEYANIVKILRSNLEHKAEVENKLNQKLLKKEEEVESLTSNLETQKHKITQLEKILLSFEEQSRKQKKCDHEKITVLENKIAEYEAHFSARAPLSEPPEHEAIDNLIKILEDELTTPFDSQINQNNDFIVSRKGCIGDYNKNIKLENFTCNETNTNLSNRDTVPTKIVTGNYIKKTYNISKNNEKVKGEKPDRRKAVTDLGNPRKWPALAESEFHIYEAEPTIKKNPMPFKNLPIIASNNLRDERKYNKMLKLAGHKM